MSDLPVEWVSGILSVAWRIKRGSVQQDAPIPRHIYALMPSHIRGWRAAARFKLLADSKEFRDAWRTETGVGEREYRRFLLKFPEGAWDRPWELLIGEVESTRRPRISIVRGLPDSSDVLPSEFDRPMSVLCILGDDGSRTGHYPLDLKHETELLLKVYDSLPAAHRSAILPPRVCQPQKSDLQKAFSEPADVVFFSGHASSNPPRFFLVDGSSVTPEEIKTLISSAPTRPMFAAFWACDTAREAKKNRGGPGPQFYLSLTQAGMASVLAMQSTISDPGAILLAQEVFQALASGDSLDIAAARARSALLDTSKMGGGDSLDWACPVVWSSGLSGANLRWNAPSSKLAHLQVVNRRARMAREARPYFPPVKEEIDFARRCSSTRLCWVKGSRFTADRERWVRLLIATESVEPRYVVAVEFDPGRDLADGLSLWAEELQTTLEIPNANGDDFRNALELIRQRPRTGWKQLCALRDLLISVWQPPEYREEIWFWDPIINGNKPAIILGETVVDQVVADGWSIEGLDMQFNEQILSTAYAEAPLVSNALALLETPVPRTSLDVLGFKADKTSQLEGLLIKTAAGEVILSASAQRQFREWMDQASVKAAHRACMKIYSHVSFAGRLTPAIRERRLNHCLGASEELAARDEICALLLRYRELNRPQAAVSLVGRIGGLWRSLPENFLIIVAWAHTMLMNIAQATFWLERSESTVPLETAWQHGLWAEIHKSKGDRQAALDEIDNAIGALRAAPTSGASSLLARRLRAYRQDRARILQYLFYEPKRAATEYQQLVEEWQFESDAAIDLAVVLRNYSECVRTEHQPSEAEWLRAKDMLDQAAALLKDNRDYPVFSEIEYEKARVAIAEGDGPAASALLDQARSDALASGHLMLAAICAARHFWEFETFESERWFGLEANLSAFPQHGWAVRTLVDGRLRAVKRMADPAVAAQSLASNVEDLNRNPSFSAGSDRFRIAASAAGFFVVSMSGGGERAWYEFLSKPWSEDWLRSNQFHSPEEVWGRVP